MLKMFQNTEGVVFQDVKEDSECWRSSRMLEEFQKALVLPSAGRQ